MTTDNIKEFSDSLYMNYTTIENVQHILTDVKQLAGRWLSEEDRRVKLPRLEYFSDLVQLTDPLKLPLQELPFSVYLITGTAGSGKSTCIQTLHENINCVITGATRMASQNVFHKLNQAYVCKHINTLYYDFGFRGNHIQMQTGKYCYSPEIETLPELQKRDLVHYWDIIRDITNNGLSVLEGKSATMVNKLLKASMVTGRNIQNIICRVCGSIPNFIKSNVIVVDEAGLLSRHLLTATVYSWWLINAVYNTPYYQEGRIPVIVCVGSPTQTDSMESNFEHKNQRRNIYSCENILTYIICNKTLNAYLDIHHHWTIFINNKRCSELEFGNLLKTLEFGLTITEDLIRYVDQFVVSKSYIMDPNNLQGWTRLFTSHDEVQAYMIRLHSHLRAKDSHQFVVFSLPMYTFIKLEQFNAYKEITSQHKLTLSKWLDNNMARISNYSQFKDHDIVKTDCNISVLEDIAVASMDITYVLNSSVSVTSRLKRYLIGFEGTFESFLSVLMDDAFLKKNNDDSHVEYTYRFLSTLMYNGMISFYNYLQAVDPGDADEIYDTLARLVSGTIPQDVTNVTECMAWIEAQPVSTEEPMVKYNSLLADDETHEEEDSIFDAITEKSIDFFYVNYSFNHPTKSQDIYEQFIDLKLLYMGRYATMAAKFGDSFTQSPFVSYINNVTTNGCEIHAHNFYRGLMTNALQTDNYTIRGYTHTPVPKFEEELQNRKSSGSLNQAIIQANIPAMVLKDNFGFVGVINFNICDFVDTVEDNELHMSTSVDYGLSSKLAMTITRSQGLGLDKVAVCFSENKLKINNVYVAMSRVTSSRYLKMDLNPLRREYEKTQNICGYILEALRNTSVQTVY
ncbi:helicase-primase helicase subunit [Testudinid alphaherpesvirus 3]|uniref:DNA helicase n=12 Tax=Herpesvirales TaxID=548681 RepID=A0A0K1R1V3_9ALPH|nr:helicase-primase helicase subunit [Testudinid alphaherpesvirus 3]AIU39290.1 helicase-primase helicase subunit [Testudinid alphaherpesvirus 3]AIU39400.1 helicase-primase helicase subunit [Testudinid alphaherpesvirus 3]AKI81676.1 helicase-primase helicase subunit [Testudinid alphaherpesvirus 3]AKI81819.1 helicase-primase helicase subunit [Testudinid alphaherpesvirus 3]AKV40676.1 DNA helicase [Testudinid alphaherpesvirus 3]